MNDFDILLQLFRSLSKEQAMIVIQLLFAVSFINVLTIFVLQLILDLFFDMIRSLVVWVHSRSKGAKKHD